MDILIRYARKELSVQVKTWISLSGMQEKKSQLVHENMVALFCVCGQLILVRLMTISIVIIKMFLRWLSATYP